jgi:hypothetical protein
MKAVVFKADIGNHPNVVLTEAYALLAGTGVPALLILNSI